MEGGGDIHLGGRVEWGYTLTKVRRAIVSSGVKRSPFQAPFVAQVFRHTHKCQTKLKLQFSPSCLILERRKRVERVAQMLHWLVGSLSLTKEITKPFINNMFNPDLP